jgi:hypothetical protein
LFKHFKSRSLSEKSKLKVANEIIEAFMKKKQIEAIRQKFSKKYNWFESGLNGVWGLPGK